MGYNYMYGYDPSYIFVILGFFITCAASLYLRVVFSKYSKISANIDLTPAEVAKLIMESNGIYDVEIGAVAGDLTDHYIPSKNVLNLSDTTRNSRSIAAYGVAAHEVGHAIQDAQNFFLLTTSIKIAPVVSFASRISLPIIVVSLILGMMKLFNIGIIAFSLTLVYQILTLPIEFDASRRAIDQLHTLHILDEDDLVGVRKVLTAAALTYVAATASTFLQLMRFMMLSRSSRSRD